MYHFIIFWATGIRPKRQPLLCNFCERSELGYHDSTFPFPRFHVQLFDGLFGNRHACQLLLTCSHRKLSRTLSYRRSLTTLPPAICIAALFRIPHLLNPSRENVSHQHRPAFLSPVFSDDLHRQRATWQGRITPPLFKSPCLRVSSCIIQTLRGVFVRLNQPQRIAVARSINNAATYSRCWTLEHVMAALSPRRFAKQRQHVSLPHRHGLDSTSDGPVPRRSLKIGNRHSKSNGIFASIASCSQGYFSSGNKCCAGG